MNIVTQEINVNVAQPNNLQFISAMQGDYDSMYIKATIYDKNALYDIDCNTIRVQGTTANGETISKLVDSYDEHTVTFKLDERMLRADGAMQLTIIFTSNGKQLTTFPFVIVVSAKPQTDFTPAEIDIFEKLVAEATKYADLSKSYAVGTNGSVREGDETDNSKYYCEQAKISSDSASRSSSSAAVSSNNAQTASSNSKYYYDEITKIINNNGGLGSGNILYYTSYDEFKKDLEDGKIRKNTLILIAGNDLGISGSNNTPTTVPSAINDLAVTSVTDTSITIKYTIPNGANGVIIYASDGTNNMMFNTTESNFVITGLSPDTTYTISAYASNNIGTSDISNIVKQKTNSSTTGGDDNNPSSNTLTSRFIYVGDNGISGYSIDGDNWIDMTGLDNNTTYNQVAYGTDKVVCVGNNGKSAYSTDGKTWNEITGLNPNYNYVEVIYGNGNFVCVGWDNTDESKTYGKGIVYLLEINTLSDEIYWEEYMDGFDSIDENYLYIPKVTSKYTRRLAYFNNSFILVYRYLDGYADIYRNDSGIWEKCLNEYESNLKGTIGTSREMPILTVTDNSIVLIDGKPGNDLCSKSIYSNDGLTWITYTTNANTIDTVNTYSDCVTYGNNCISVITENNGGFSHLYVSTDDSNYTVWSDCTNNMDAPTHGCILFDGNRFITIKTTFSTGSYLHVSSDGNDWESKGIIKINGGTGINLYSILNHIVYGNNNYICFAQSEFVSNTGYSTENIIINSTDCINWKTSCVIPNNQVIQDMIYVNIEEGNA